MNNKMATSTYLTLESKNQTNKKSDEQIMLVNGIKSGAWTKSHFFQGNFSKKPTQLFLTE